VGVADLAAPPPPVPAPRDRLNVARGSGALARCGGGGHRAAMLVRTLLFVSLATAGVAQEAAWLVERGRRIDELLAAEVQNGNHAGISYLVMHGSDVVAHGAFGVGAVDGGWPLQRNSIVRIYSMTKPITAIAALTLVERGALRLDQPIRELAPEFAEPRVFTGGTADAPQTAPAQKPITVRMLLNHTSGLTYDFFRDSPLHELYRRADLWAATSTDDFCKRVAALPLLAEPGTAWNYSVADDVLGVVIERAAKVPFADYVREHVTAPLGMVDTAFDVAPDQRDRLAILHRREQGKLATMAPTFGVWAEAGRGFAAGGAGMFSTLDDYARFGRFLLGDGSLDGRRVLARKTMELMRTDSLRDGQRTSRPADGWGLCSAIVRDPGAGADLMSAGTLHWNGAATTTFFADPREQLVAVMFAQHLPFDEHKLIGRFRTAVYQALR
jgi:CubicO group peptidase (beta-lactamase class C family)